MMELGSRVSLMMRFLICENENGNWEIMEEDGRGMW